MTKDIRVTRIKPTSEYPCQWDDLIGPNKKVIATIYTPEEGKKDNLKPGITKGKDGIYDIVVHAKEINNEVARNALRNLEKVTGKQYIFVSTTSSEDRIINYAGRLMRPLKKYGNPDEGYVFQGQELPDKRLRLSASGLGRYYMRPLHARMQRL